VDKVLVEQPSPEAKVRVMLPMYNPLKATSCKKCGKLLAEPKELIRIVKTKKT
jgi:RNase P subunit RPR2